eukprot:6128026-Pleurochrysis_carterae.AAC.1
MHPSMKLGNARRAADDKLGGTASLKMLELEMPVAHVIPPEEHAQRATCTRFKLACVTEMCRNKNVQECDIVPEEVCVKTTDESMKSLSKASSVDLEAIAIH